MQKLLVVLLVLVLAPPSIASAVESSGTLVVVPNTGADSGGEPTPKSWLADNVFFVRAHICRTTASVTLCGPDPLVSSGTSFKGLVRIWVPFIDLYTVHLIVTDSEGNVIRLASGNFSFGGDTYNDIFSNYSPPLPDGLYKFLGLAIGNGSGLITFSNYYQFRVGGPSSFGCCP